MGTPCAPHVSLHGGSVLLPDDGSLMWVMLMGWPGGGDGAAEAGFQNPELSGYQNAVVKELSSAGGAELATPAVIPVRLLGLLGLVMEKQGLNSEGEEGLISQPLAGIWGPPWAWGAVGSSPRGGGSCSPRVPPGCPILSPSCPWRRLAPSPK